MQVRALKESDLPILRAMYDGASLEFEWPNLAHPDYVEKRVLVDENDVPLAAGVARLVPEIILLLDQKQHPAAKLAMVRRLHEELLRWMTEKGYTDANCFVPEAIVRPYGRRLVQQFGWVPNQTSFLIRRG